MSKLFRAVYLSVIMGAALTHSLTHSLTQTVSCFACSSTIIEPHSSDLESLFADSQFSPVADIPSGADISYLSAEVVIDVKRRYGKWTLCQSALYGDTVKPKWVGRP
ncbi:MAG: hypothetical protein ACRC1W_17515 [Shewanella sp.]